MADRMSDFEKALILLPFLEDTIFKIVSSFIKSDTKDMTKEEMIAALDKARSDNWKQFDFISSKR